MEAAFTRNALNQFTAVGGVSPSYDANGSRTEDGRGSAFSYDEENRLVAVTKGGRRSEFDYDGLGRRVETREPEEGALTRTIRYVHDGLLVVEELEWAGATEGEPGTVRQFTRGADLSGGLDGSGGIGGLLAFTLDGASSHYFSDAIGNVAGLYTPAGTPAAAYTYDAFGRRLSATGPLAEANPLQWSGKEYHEASGLVSHLHRFYDPETSKWLTRDPLGEEGGVNLYGFVANDPVNLVDP